jgi:hypothetical protein
VAEVADADEDDRPALPEPEAALMWDTSSATS